MLSVICWLWKPRPGYAGPIYTTAHVHALCASVAEHYPLPHRFICVTDTDQTFEDGIELVRLWQRHADVPNPSAPSGPSCYRRLFSFADEARDLFGERFVSLDLDCAIVDKLTPLWHRDEDFVIWGNPAGVAPYNASMYLMTAGARSEVWTSFDPDRSPAISRGRGFYGSDQGHIAACLGPGEATWCAADGVCSYRRHVRKHGKLPAGARIVFFPGRDKPWQRHVVQANRWLQGMRIAAT